MVDEKGTNSKLMQIFPKEVCDIDIYQTYKIEDEFHLRINMVSSLDGAISMNGRAKGLSSTVDQSIFHVLRSLADIILVGAGTMRDEEYKPARMSDEEKQLRVSNDQQEIPPIAIVTRSGKIDLSSKFFTEAVSKPIIFTTELGSRVLGNTDLADVYICGESKVDLKEVIDQLHKLVYRHILCEGGPSLNADMLEQNLVDELCLTTNPLILQGINKTIFNGPLLEDPAQFSYKKIFINEGQLFSILKKS